MVTLQILVLSFWVRIPMAQHFTALSSRRQGFFFPLYFDTFAGTSKRDDMKILNFRDVPETLHEAVWALYEESFPAHERRSRKAQETACSDREARSEVMLDDDGTLMAIMFYWLHGDTVYVEFLAVNPALHGRSIGSRVIGKLLETYPGKLVVLEIEPPEDEMSVRRLHFYERLGFVRNPHPYTHPSYRKGADAHPHDLVIMSHGRPVSDGEFDGFLGFMKDVVWQYAD